MLTPITRFNFRQLVLCNFALGFAILLIILTSWMVNRLTWQDQVSCQVTGYQINCTFTPTDSGNSGTIDWSDDEQSCQIRPTGRVGHLLSDQRIQFDICDPKKPIPFGDAQVRTFNGSQAEHRVKILMQVKWPLGYQSPCWVRSDCKQLDWYRGESAETAAQILLISIILLMVCLGLYLIGSIATIVYYCWKYRPNETNACDH